jgi:carbonic anhydrase
MKPNNVSLIHFAVGMLAATSISVTAADEQQHWSYEGKHGATHWGGMDTSFAQCKFGKEQSPIDIRNARKSALAPIGFAYAAGAAEIVNNGHTIQVNLRAGGMAKVDATEYKLLQFHFHTPSEESINGESYPMVAHMVHKNAEGKLAVVAVLFREGSKNRGLETVFNAFPKREGDVRSLTGNFNPVDILPTKRGYYRYIGSLTTPPCSEGVRWFVLKQHVELSKQQIEAFRKIYKMNARPVQPLNGRLVEQN